MASVKPTPKVTAGLLGGTLAVIMIALVDPATSSVIDTAIGVVAAFCAAWLKRDVSSP